MRQQLDKVSPALFEVIRFDLRKGDRRKVEILESAIHCLATRGIENTTFEEIGRRIGIRKSHVAYHFPNMDKLIETAMRYTLSSLQNNVVNRIKNETDWRKAIEAQARGTIEWAKDFPQHAQVYVLFCYRCSYVPRLRAINREFRKRGIGRFIGMLGPLAEASQVESDELYRLARRAQDMVFGAVLTYVSWGAGRNLEEIVRNTLKGEFDLIESVLPAAARDK